MSAADVGFGARLATAVVGRGPLCVGIDPHAHLLEAWDLPDTAAGAERLGLEVVAAAATRVAIVKPQVAFFERFGSAGYAALERVMAAARDAGLLVLADTKRGDLDSTMAAYAEAWLRPGSPLEADAITATAFMGVGSLEPALRLAEEEGKGVFVLCATSNPEAAGMQSRRDEHGVTVAGAVEREVDEWNRAHGRAMGSIGLVVGATIDAADLGVSLSHPTPILAPGFGHQGARLADLRTRYPEEALVLASASRSLLATRVGLVDAIDRATEEAR